MRSIAALFVLVALVLAGLRGEARALDSIDVPLEAPALDLTGSIERYIQIGDRIQVSTAPGADGLVRRMEVRASGTGPTPGWIVFALSNESDEQIDRLLVAPHYRLANSKLIWPDLGAQRILSVTPSQGFRPDRQDSTDADEFLITLDPGSTVTFVAELASESLPKLYLWEPAAYERHRNSLTLFQGIVLGISGLLALFLTTLFIVRGTAMFPAAASLAWSVLAYLAVDFGLVHKVLDVSAAQHQIYRAGAEVLIATTLVIFLFSYLNLGRWHIRLAHVTALWLLGMVALMGLAVGDPVVAAGIARMSLGVLGAIGILLIIVLALQGYDRAIMLVPTWLLFLVWLYGAGRTVLGVIDNDLVGPAMAGGLVLLVLLIGFTVMQHAFAGGTLAHWHISDPDRKALALTGSGDMVWDWDVARDRVFTSAETERLLSLKRGTLDGPAVRWVDYLHPSDRDRFRTCLDTLVDQRCGRLDQDFRLRKKDGQFAWLKLRARPVLGADGEVVRLVGTLSDVTEQRTAQERLLHDAIHDNLTGLPNRELFLDRLQAAMTRTRTEGAGPASVLVIDIDRFRNVNDDVGMAIGDSILLTVARRLQRHLRPQDTLARLDGDQFGVILLSETVPKRIALAAETVRRSFQSAIKFADREVILTASLGVAIHNGKQQKPNDLLRDAELAMAHAKRLGGDRVEAFKPALRGPGTTRLSIETDLRRALEKDEVHLAYQPIINLQTGRIAGFEALLRWQHPKHGLIPPSEFIEVAEDTGLIIDLGLFALDRAAHQLAEWQEIGSGTADLFTSVNVSSRQLVRHDLINDIKGVLTRTELKPSTLKLEITESLMMENPEYVVRVLERVRELGAGLALDDFGTGHSALSYLQRFPFDLIKVDRSFVRQNGNGARPLILRSIVGLVHELGMQVVGEGAETPGDAAELKALGCEFAQGFLYGEPMSTSAATRLLTGAKSARIPLSADAVKRVAGAVKEGAGAMRDGVAAMRGGVAAMRDGVAAVRDGATTRVAVAQPSKPVQPAAGEKPGETARAPVQA